MSYVLTRRRFLKTAAFGAIGLGGAGFYAWGIEPHWIEIVRRDLPVALLPEGLVGRSLIQISDMHVGPQVDDDYLVETLEKVRSLEPDILVFTGDSSPTGRHQCSARPGACYGTFPGDGWRRWG